MTRSGRQQGVISAHRAVLCCPANLYQIHEGYIRAQSIMRIAHQHGVICVVADWHKTHRAALVIHYSNKIAGGNHDLGVWHRDANHLSSGNGKWNICGQKAARVGRFSVHLTRYDKSGPYDYELYRQVRQGERTYHHRQKHYQHQRCFHKNLSFFSHFRPLTKIIISKSKR